MKIEGDLINKIIVEVQENLTDPRKDQRRIKHDFKELMIIAILASMSGECSFYNMELFGKSKLEILTKFLKLKNGIPSHDTFRRIFSLLDSDKFGVILLSCTRLVTEKKETLKQITIDGKAVRGSADSQNNLKAIYTVNAYLPEAKISLATLKVEDKSNEIPALKKLISCIDLKGAVVTADALHCQKETASLILERKGEYLLAVKDNQRYLAERVYAAFEEYKDYRTTDYLFDHDMSEERKKGFIRVRECTVLSAVKGKTFPINLLDYWDGLQSVVKATTVSTKFSTGELTTETRYFISSAKRSAQDFAELVRTHWSVENNLHRILDVHFKEDACTVRDRRAAENLTILRQFSLNLLNLFSNGTKMGPKDKQKSLAWKTSYLVEILEAFFCSEASCA